MDLIKDADETGKELSLPNIARQVFMKNLFNPFWQSAKGLKTTIGYLSSLDFPEWTEKGPYRKIVAENLRTLCQLPERWLELDDNFIRALLVWGVTHWLDMEPAIKAFPNFRTLAEEYLQRRSVVVPAAFAKLSRPGGNGDQNSLAVAGYKELAIQRALNTLMHILLMTGDILVVPAAATTSSTGEFMFAS